MQQFSFLINVLYFSQNIFLASYFYLTHAHVRHEYVYRRTRKAMLVSPSMLVSTSHLPTPSTHLAL